MFQTSPTLLRNLLALLYICIALPITTVNAQNSNATLNQQYQEIVGGAGSYQGYKQVKETRLQALWQSSMDSLQKERQMLYEAQEALGTNGSAIDSAKSELAAAQKSLAEAQARKDELAVLGMSVNKNSYNTLVWGIIVLLIAGIAFMIYRSSAAGKEARYRTDLYNELFEEYRDHKVKANEKEKKLARELQTERNMLAEIKGR